MNTYGDIILPDYNQSVLESIKATEAKLLALNISLNRSEVVNSDDEKSAIEYIEQWYKFSYERRAWIPK